MAKKFLTDINIAGGVYDSSGDIGSSGQVLSSTGSGINWIDANSAASVVYQDGFTGNGSTTAFTLANSIDNENKTQVYIDGVYQHKDNYSLSGTTLTFSTAPPNSSDIEVISFSSVSSADDILYDTDFGSAGLMTTNGSGVYSITTNNSANWNTAYTYSQVGHLPLAGGTLTGDVTTTGHYFADTHFRSTDTAASLSTTGAGIVYLRPNAYDSTSGQFTLDSSGDGTFARDVTVGRNLVADSGTASHRLRSSVTTAAVLQIRPLGTRTGITPVIQYRHTETGGVKYLMAGTGGTYFGNYNSGIPTDVSSMIRLSSDNSNNPSIGIGDSGSGTAHLDIGGNVLITNSGNSYFNGGNVGIGTTSPGSRRLNIVTSDSGNDVGFESTISRTSGSNYGIRGLANGSGATTNIGGFFEASGATTNRALWAYVGHVLLATQNTNDYVGIGTESPAAKLDVNSSAVWINPPDGSHAGLHFRQGGAFKGFVGYNDSTDVVNLSMDGSIVNGINVNASHNVGIGTSSPDSKLDVTGGDITVNTTGTGFMNFKYSGSQKGTIGTDGIDLKITANADLQLLPTGNVGIGTTSPSTKLHIEGASVGYLQTIKNTTAGGDYLQMLAETGDAVFEFNSGGTGGEATLNMYRDGTQYVKISADAGVNNYFNNGSNVGIGVVPNAVTAGNIRLDVGYVGCGITSRQNAELVLTSNADYVTATTTGRNAIMINLQNDGNFNILNAPSTTAGSALTFSSRFYINTSGNVGIGNTNPLAKLQITSGDSGASSPWSNADELILESSGNAGLAFQTPNTGAATIAFQDPESVQAGFIQYLHADNALRFATNGNNERMRIDSSGNVGIGTASPQRELHLHTSSSGGSFIAFTNDTTGQTSTDGAIVGIDSSEDLRILQYENKPIRFSTNGSERMRIDSSGNVGIGTTSPSHKLQINDGSMLIEKDQQSGGADHNFIQLVYNGGWSGNVNGLAAINVTDGLPSNQTVGKFGITYDGSQGKFVLTNLYNGGYGASGDVFTVRANGTTYMAGNVGIGTSSPSRKLDVNGEITHEGLVPKAGAFVDGLVTINKTVSISANTWTSLDISLSNIGGSGTFAVQVYSNAHGSTGGAWYSMYWSGIMSWYHSSTNDDDIDEIPLHMAGHARNNNTLELRTKLHTADGSSYANRCELQIKTANALSSAPISFRFRKLL